MYLSLKIPCSFSGEFTSKNRHTLIDTFRVLVLISTVYRIAVTGDFFLKLADDKIDNKNLQHCGTWFKKEAKLFRSGFAVSPKVLRASVHQ